MHREKVMPAWHVLFTKPRQEDHLQAQLTQAGIETYLPRFPRPQRRSTAAKPLFPRYLFARLAEAQVHPTEIRWTPGLSHVVRIADEYAMVDNAVIEHIRRRLAQIRAKGSAPFRPGQVVKLPEGHPLGDLEVIFEKSLSGGARAQVLIHILGRLTRADVEMVDLSPVGPETL
jgi:transcriptional antiterminator RfaH